VLPTFAPSASTWRWSANGLPLRARLDHVLHDASFRAIDAGVIDGGRSDHLPVWAELERTGVDLPGAKTSP
jgi:endonuclease/exonuclease/phosphatase family metal-dependent hydrolase